MACLQCPTMYAQMDEKTGEAVQISKPIPLPALNVRPNLKMATQYLHIYMYYVTFVLNAPGMFVVPKCMPIRGRVKRIPLHESANSFIVPHFH